MTFPGVKVPEKLIFRRLEGDAVQAGLLRI